MSHHIQNPEEDVKEYQSRFKILYIFVGLAAVIISSRLWYLQIVKGSELDAFSRRNLIKETKIPSPRGLVLDRNNEVLVDNLPGSEATINPQQTTHLEETAEALSEIVQIPPKKIVNLVETSRRKNGPFRSVRIKENLTREEVARIKRIRIHHPGLNVNSTILRHYPLEEDGAQLFGYVGEISKRQIRKLNQKYKGKLRFEQGDIIGKSGLEENWEEQLRGQEGIDFVPVDARGRKTESQSVDILGFEPQPPTAGNNIVLTIDKDIQEAAYIAMQREDKIGPRTGAVVAIKSNGEILAWVNSPSYDPNQFATGISSELWKELINHPFKPLRNKVIQDHYSPGSTFKPIVALAALQEGEITEDTIVSAPSVIRFGGRPYHDHTKTGHGNITVAEALERSSNVFFYKMGIALGIDRMAAYARLVGLGRETNLNLAGEQPGLVPTKEWKLRRFGEAWQPGENLSNAIGQGFVLATPLQMALAFNTIGLEGKLYQPFLVKKVVSTEGEVLEEFEPKLLYDASVPGEREVYVSKENFRIVKKGLRAVANGDRGTARWWKIPGVEIAGKTGTSQVMSFSADQIYDKCNERPIHQRHHGWFVGYAPAAMPDITVAVLAEHACAGSSGGAPIVRDVIKAYMEKYHPERLTTHDRKVANQ